MLSCCKFCFRKKNWLGNKFKKIQNLDWLKIQKNLHIKSEFCLPKQTRKIRILVIKNSEKGLSKNQNYK